MPHLKLTYIASIGETNIPLPDIRNAINKIKSLLKKSGMFKGICPMESKILDFYVSLYTKRPPKEESGDARKIASNILEQNFTIITK